ncbi:beta-phosphoglucomutase [Philodulcilactobacillus myokoensis]|uniref:Beta-phosphoglucomutase n=1 Tax=Philodulcilactobacillus myokoensis TaxID=2929573 RepID=A0A9W6B1Q3_9LACO|nr:beta-phosphoglucomutase [Philodulcilactobacillus myokoensis]GLB47329.1 beta-phosphoglucomutase [Philodulcilactobacillus myokoensis]
MVKFSDIKGFVFDLDGVITVTSIYHSKAWHQIADEVGTKWSDKLANSLKGVDRVHSLARILKAGGKETAYTDQQKKDLMDKKNHLYLQYVDKMGSDEILPGIKSFLADLKRHHYAISLASSSRNSPKVLKKLNLTSYFGKVVDPATLKHGKPDPEIYAKGAKILNLDPRRCIGIEDAVVGVQSINAAGETSIGIGDSKVLHEADMVFPDTSKLTLANIKKHMDQ